MMNGISGSGGYSTQMQMQGMQKRQGQGERFNKLDTDGNGGIDQTELQTMGDKISEITGQQINVTELSEANDANNDGLLDKQEMQSMMMGLRDTLGGLQGGGGPPSQQSLAAYQADTEKDLTSTLLDMLGESDDKEDEEQNEYNSLDLQV